MGRFIVKTMTKSTFKETEQDGASPEDVDPDGQSKRQRFMPYMLKTSVVALSGTSIPVTSEEGPSAPMTRQATDVWVPLKELARGIAAPVLQAPVRNAPVLRSRTTASDVATPASQSYGKETPVPRFPTSPRDATVSIPQPTTNATPKSPSRSHGRSHRIPRRTRWLPGDPRGSPRKETKKSGGCSN